MPGLVNSLVYAKAYYVFSLADLITVGSGISYKLVITPKSTEFLMALSRYEFLLAYAKGITLRYLAIDSISLRTSNRP